MKILVISLLRLGDILLATPVINGLRQRHANAEIHLLINKQFKSVAGLIPHVDEIHCFDRSELQQIIGQTDRSLLEAYYRVESIIHDLRNEDFDQVINLTHNRLSAWVGGLIGCPDTRGITFTSTGQVSTGSEWFEYLNDYVTQGVKNAFHYVDVFHYGAGLDAKDRRLSLRETKGGRAFAQKFMASISGSRLVVVQPCTSEEKKTLSPQKWREACQIMRQGDPQVEIAVLGAPNEKTVVDAICVGEDFKPVICGLDEAYSLLLRAKLLITGDTSIKHLASATPVRILEVSIGSSAFHKTGAYSNGSVILQTKVRCAPCPHSMPCHQPSHLCGDKMPVELVAMAATSLLRNDESSLRVLAHEYREDVAIFKTNISAQGDWAAYPLATPFSHDEIGVWIDRTSHKLLLQGSHQRMVGEFGSEGLNLRDLLRSIYPDQSSQDWRAAFGTLEKEVLWLESQLEGLLRQMQQQLPRLTQLDVLYSYLQVLSAFVQSTEKTAFFASYGHELRHILSQLEHEGASFRNIKKLRERLIQAHQRSRIELKLVRGLQNEFMELT